MKSKRRVRRRVGNVVLIPLRGGRVGFGWVHTEPLVAFFDYCCDARRLPEVGEVVGRSIAFRIWVMNRALTDGKWRVLGHAAVPPELLETHWFFKQDPISRKLWLTRTGEEEVAADFERCKSLECAAVWEADHVVDRLVDHFARRPNRWMESLRPRPPGHGPK